MSSTSSGIRSGIAISATWGAPVTVREIAANHQLNPITVSKSFQVLVDEGLVTKKRGIGMFVVEGARENLIKRERALFVEWELPRIKQRAEDLGFNVEILIEEHT